MKKVVITQSNYIPWKGYFDAIALADVFVVYDDMQYTKRDWRNRNVIKTPKGTEWLTIPVEVKGKYFQKINETKIADKSWTVSHWEKIKQNYNKAKCFKEMAPAIDELYKNCNFDYLTDVNLHFITGINNLLGIKTEVKFSSEFNLAEEKTQRLVAICSELNATDYYSGPAAKQYMDEQKFAVEKINVHYFDYLGYKEYEQLYGDFTHAVSILDLIFNKGTDTKKYMKSFNI